MSEKKFEVSVIIDNQLICDMLVTALEGGSNYWYYLPETYMVIKNKDKSLAENIFDTIMTTKDKIPVSDIEDSVEAHNLLGYITFDNIQRGINLMAKDYPEHYSDMLDETFDAETADVFFQLVVMGEIVYA